MEWSKSDMVMNSPNRRYDSMWRLQLKEFDRRIKRAGENNEAPEVLSALIFDAADFYSRTGWQAESETFRGIARNVAQMNGMRERLSWWERKVLRKKPTDYNAIIEAYRRDEK